MMNAASPVTEVLPNTLSHLPKYHPDDFLAFFRGLLGSRELVNAFFDGNMTPKTWGSVAVAQESKPSPQEALSRVVYRRLIQNTWPDVRSFDRSRWAPPNPEFVQQLDALVLRVRALSSIKDDPHARMLVLREISPNIALLTDLALRHLKKFINPAKDSYLAAQTMFRTLCEWRYGYDGDQSRVSDRSDTLVITPFLRGVAEWLGCEYIRSSQGRASLEKSISDAWKLSQSVQDIRVGRSTLPMEDRIARLDVSEYSNAALLPAWNLLNSVRLFLSPAFLRATRDKVNLDAWQWKELGDAYWEMYTQSRTHEVPTAFFTLDPTREKGITQHAFTQEDWQIFVHCDSPVISELGLYEAKFVVHAWEPSPRIQHATLTDALNDAIDRHIQRGSMIRIPSIHAVSLQVLTNGELSVGSTEPASLQRVLGAESYYRVRSYVLYWLVQCVVQEIEVCSPAHVQKHIPSGFLRKNGNAPKGRPSPPVLTQFPRPPKNLIVGNVLPPVVRPNDEVDPDRFVGSHSRILARSLRPSFLAFVRSRIRGQALRMWMIDHHLPAGQNVVQTEIINAPREPMSHDMAYRHFMARADALSAQYSGDTYTLRYETLAWSISPQEAEVLEKNDCEVDPERIRMPKAQSSPATLANVVAGDAAAILGAEGSA